ncbi:MAG: hypothetical protein HOQ11_01120 [Gemmatimonadaceae bacterium]|nr:hypothetical protein [Gemmatimonadaceae bacterium]
MRGTRYIVGAVAAIAALTAATTAVVWNGGARPSLALDYKQLKFAYSGLFAANSERHHLAGSPVFGIATDSRRPVSDVQVRDLGRRMTREAIFSLAYQPEDTSAAGPATRQLEANRQYPTALLRDVRRVVVENASTTGSPGFRLAIHRVDSVPDGPGPDDTESRAREALRLFDRLLSEKVNGSAPLGNQFDIPYDELVKVYGYGQCDNLSFALADLLRRKGIPSSLVHLHPNSHTVVEADFGGKKGLLDPLLGIAFVDTTGMSSLQHDVILKQAAVLARELAPQTQAIFRSYYVDARVSSVREFDARATARSRELRLGAGERAEYLFEQVYPWITTRDIGSPPAGAVGFLRVTRTLSAADFVDRADGRIATLEMPYPIVDVEVVGDPGSTPPVAIGTEHGFAKIEGVDSSGTARLARYLPGDGSQYSVELRLEDNAAAQRATHLRVRVVSQFALPRFAPDPTRNFVVVSTVKDPALRVTLDEGRAAPR